MCAKVRWVAVCVSLSALLATAGALGSRRTHTVRVTAVTGHVQIDRPRMHEAQVGEELPPGARILVRSSAFATVDFNGRVRIDMSGDSVLRTAGPQDPATAAPIGIERGRVHAIVRPAERGRSGVAIGAGVARALSSAGHFAVAVSGASSASVTVFSGSARLTGPSNSVMLTAGTAATAARNFPIAPPEPARQSPQWEIAPPSTVLYLSGADPWTGILADPASGPDGARGHRGWHVQIARDEAFEHLVLNEVRRGGRISVEHRPESTGQYFVRAIAIDSDGRESALGRPSVVSVRSPRLVHGAAGQVAHVEVPEGIFCGIDGAAARRTAERIPLTPERAHEIRCSARADGSQTRSARYSIEDSGPVVWDFIVEHNPDLAPDRPRCIAVRLADAAGSPISLAQVEMRTPRGVRSNPLVESEERGLYTTTIWPQRGLESLDLEFLLNGTAARRVRIDRQGPVVEPTRLAGR